MHRHVSDGDSNKTDGGEHDAQTVERVPTPRGLSPAEDRGGPATQAVPGPGSAARSARGGGQSHHARV